MGRLSGAWLLALLTAWLLPFFIPAAGVQAAPMAAIDPAQGPIGTLVTVQGSGWPAGQTVTVSLGKPEQTLGAWLIDWAKGRAASDGTLRLTAEVPRRYTALSGKMVEVKPGNYSVVVAVEPGTDGSTTVVGAMFTVTPGVASDPPTIAPRFSPYYYQHDGGRLLGNPISGVRFEGPWRAQYFEKGRLEDHQGEPGATGDWRFMYGRLAAELAASGAPLPVGGDTSSVTYETLYELAAPERRVPPPPGWRSVQSEDDAPVFVPVDAGLQPAPGHYVPLRFWAYINQPALFPAGWLHDIGLPLTPAVPATVSKIVGSERVERTITVQLFERTVLTDDPANPPSFQIERANVGADYLKLHPEPGIPGDVVLHPAFRWLDPQPTIDHLPDGMAGPAWQWQSQVNQQVQMADEIAYLQRELETEGWRVTQQTGDAASGALVAVKGQRQQVITWWRGTRPDLPRDQSALGTQMQVLVGLQA